MFGQFKVASLDSLKDTYECVIGNFGVPLYGGTLVGTVAYPKANLKACKGFDEVDISFKSKPGGLPTFLLVDIGGSEVWNTLDSFTHIAASAIFYPFSEQSRPGFESVFHSPSYGLLLYLISFATHIREYQKLMAFFVTNFGMEAFCGFQVNSEARKYKTAPLQHRDLLEKLFESLFATEDYAWSSVQPLEPTELVQSLISAFTAQGESSTSSARNDDPTKVVNVLKDIVSSYEIDNILIFKSLKFLGGKDSNSYRLMFLVLEPEQCAKFLEAILS
ncbi:hypothetical protein GIB67_031990 [Kingdonia uniflora]|uniref:Uncharacterized protein n=1 Tax=Kingdonia uniflora TaxID=39325 RepID=A0A7J7MWA6_9MAGN|nr:hypothetical protein GIB67_031990 [Kingdonia uniflora]